LSLIKRKKEANSQPILGISENIPLTEYRLFREMTPGCVEQPTVDDRQSLVLEESATVVEESHLREVLPFIKTSYSRLPIFAVPEGKTTLC
jgi:hypothetical protein